MPRIVKADIPTRPVDISSLCSYTALAAMNAMFWPFEQFWRWPWSASKVTSFTIIYHCIDIQYRAEANVGAACKGLNDYAYQALTSFIGHWCPHKYQLYLRK
jgi:hypothetical protein